MLIIRIIIGITAAIGIGFILADVLHVPSYKTTKLTSNLGRRIGEKKTSTVEILLRDFSVWLSGRLRLNDYKKAQFIADLRTAGMDISPELYMANAITKALCLGIIAIPTFIAFKVPGLLIAVAAVFVFLKESRAVTKKIAEKRRKIEYELPRFVSVIEKTLKHSRDVIYVLESFKNSTCPEFRQELEITVADMRSGNNEAAITRLESRVGSTMLSDVTRGLIAVERGDDTDVYWATTAMKFADYQRQQLKAQANAVPRKVRRLSMALLFCFILIYVAVLGQVLLSSMGTLL